MSKRERHEFLAWHQEIQNRNDVFDFRKEIIEYCQSDVHVLRRCCLKFKELMQETCDLDPLLQCVTIASACNQVFRQQFLQEETIGLIPPQRYQPARKYSVLALNGCRGFTIRLATIFCTHSTVINNASMVTMLMATIQSAESFMSLWAVCGMVVRNAITLTKCYHTLSKG